MKDYLIVVDMQKDFVDGAFLPEVPIVVEEKCCAGVTPESHENALKAMQSCQIKVI